MQMNILNGAQATVRTVNKIKIEKSSEYIHIWEMHDMSAFGQPINNKRCD